MRAPHDFDSLNYNCSRCVPPGESQGRPGRARTMASEPPSSSLETIFQEDMVALLPQPQPSAPRARRV